MEMEFRMLSVKEVMKITGLSRTTIWRRVKQGDFPIPRQLGPRRFGWVSTEINDYLINLPLVSYGKVDRMNGEVRPS